MIITFRALRSWVPGKSLVAPNIVGTPSAAEAYKPPKEQVNFSAFPAHNEISKPHKLKYSNIFLTQSKITFNSRNSNNKNDQIGSNWQIGHFEFLWDVLLWERKHGKKNWKFQHSLVAWPPTGGSRVTRIFNGSDSVTLPLTKVGRKALCESLDFVIFHNS